MRLCRGHSQGGTPPRPGQEAAAAVL